MSNISLVEAKLPPGFRFHPRDEELVCDYLMKKVASTDTLQLMIEVDTNKCEPWDIPETALVGGKEWYFYSQRDRKYATGLRKNRATASGYWKATGKDRTILSKDTLVGMRKTLVFYQGRAPKGRKTDWVMHEFRLEGPLSPPNISTLEDWVLCRVFCKSREIISKHGSMGSCYDDTGSSSLPPLMDSYIIFDQNQPNLDDIYDNHDGDDDEQQVPCFSIHLSQNQSNPTSLEDIMITNHQHHHHMEPNIIPPTTKTLTSLSSADEQIPMNNLASCLDSFPSDKKVINAVLNHLNQLDTYLNVKESPSFEGGSSDQSYLAGLALPNIWN